MPENNLPPLTFSAASSGQTLTITHTLTNDGGDGGNIALQAVTLLHNRASQSRRHNYARAGGIISTEASEFPHAPRARRLSCQRVPAIS